MTIHVEYDNAADCLYLRHTNNDVSRTVEIDADTLVDVDAAGRVVGVEILFASQSGIDVQSILRNHEAARIVEEPVRKKAPQLNWASA